MTRPASGEWWVKHSYAMQVYEGIEKGVKTKREVLGACRTDSQHYFMRWNSTTSPCPLISTVIGVPSLAPFNEDLPRSVG